MQQHQPYIDQRRPQLMNNKNKTRNDDFYTKLERIRLSAAAASSSKQRTATELLAESKALFVKSHEVLYNQQTLTNEERMISTCRTTQTHRSCYHDGEYEQDQCQSDLSLQLSTSSITDYSDCVFESVSLLSLSDQTTVDSANSNSLHMKRTVVPSSITIIERNARIIKWLFQLHKMNASPSC